MHATSCSSRRQWTVGGINLEVSCSEGVPRSWNGVYPSFQTPLGETQPIRVVLQVDQVGDWFSDTPQDLKTSLRNDGALYVETNDIRGVFRTIGSEIQATAQVYIGAAGLRKLLRISLSLALPLAGGVLLHASAVLTPHGVIAFLGPSGAGKTTLAVELRGPAATFSVDQTAAVAGPDGQWKVYPTPMSDLEGLVESRAACPLAALVFPVQAERNAIEPLDHSRCLSELLKNTIVVARSPDHDRCLLDRGIALATSVPAGRMLFRREEGFWPLLEDFLGDVL